MAVVETKGRWMLGVGVVGALMVVTAAGSASSLATIRKSIGTKQIPNVTEMAARIADRGPCPKNMALVGKSCVDQYEGALVEIKDDGTEKTKEKTVTERGDGGVTVTEEKTERKPGYPE